MATTTAILGPWIRPVLRIDAVRRIRRRRIRRRWIRQRAIDGKVALVVSAGRHALALIPPSLISLRRSTFAPSPMLPHRFCDAAAMLLLSPPRESSRTRTTGQSTGSICRSTPSVCRWYGTRFSNTPPLTAIVRRGTAIVVVHLTAAVAIQQRRWLAAAFSL